MPRQPRFNLADVPQHIVQRGHNRQPTFFADADYRRYLATLGAAAKAHACEVHAYVLMPNHIHLLVTPRKPAGVSRLMQSLAGRYAQYLNAAHGRSGTPWEGRYKASLVDSERYLLACYRYIEANPVRAGMVANPGDYPWSSHGHNGAGVGDGVIVEHALYGALGATGEERRAAYRALFAGEMGETDQTGETDESGGRVLRAIRAALNRDGVLGGEAFKDDIAARLARPARPGRRGRPRGKARGGRPDAREQPDK